MIAAVVLVCSFGGLGIITTHDYFAWNRARWDAIEAAERMGANPDTMDGGFEYNGYFHPYQTVTKPPPGRSSWWVKDDRWIVAFVDVPGYDEVERFPVSRWWARTPPVVRLLRRHGS